MEQDVCIKLKDNQFKYTSITDGLYRLIKWYHQWYKDDGQLDEHAEYTVNFIIISSSISWFIVCLILSPIVFLIM